MIRITTMEELLAKPLCMMTGEEFTLLLNNTQKVTAKVPAEVAPEKHYEYGIAGGCGKSPVLVKSIVSDFTPESLVSVHKNNPRGITLLVDEILTLFKSANRYTSSSILNEMLLSSWSGQPIDCVRKSEKKPVNVQKPCMNIIGSIQTQLMSEIFRKEYTANGLKEVNKAFA